jgi:DNA-directed RNA polymerase sigma subunit (sigma70/sigma32)
VAAAAAPSEAPTGRRTAYSDIGREAVERLVELGREVATLRGALRTAREEVRVAREARDEAERRSSGLSSRVKELEARAEMAESNLRTLLAAARGSGRDAPVGDTEMEAILGVLKGATVEGPPAAESG